MTQPRTHPKLRLGVWCAALRADSLLLSRRRDLNVWALPGGRVDWGERLEDAAVREVMEETGISVSRLVPVGLYYLGGWRRLNVLFRGQADGPGMPLLRTAETGENRFFPIADLPAAAAGQVARDALSSDPVTLRTLTDSPRAHRQIRRKLALRYVTNLLRGKPEPRFPTFTICATAVVQNAETGYCLTFRGHDRGAEIRTLPRIICDGRVAPWAALSASVADRSGIQAGFRWAGLIEDASLGRYEFVFHATVPDQTLFRAGEWSSARTVIVAGTDELVLEQMRTASVTAVWTRERVGLARSGDTILR